MIKVFILKLIRFYQFAISPLFAPSCRFSPSCSHYMYDSIGKYGFFRGGLLGVRRIFRCNPWHAGGYDPVP